MSEKKTHKEAHYVKRSPFLNKWCGTCSMFRSLDKNRCTLVVDPIEYGGWCSYHEPKSKRKEPKRHDLAAQVAVLGADSLLPNRKSKA